MINPNDVVIDVVATTKGKKPLKLKYLGGTPESWTATSYFPNNDVVQSFNNFSMGQQVLAIGILYYHYCPEIFKDIYHQKLEFIQEFIARWYDKELPELNREKFLFFDLAQWDAINDDGITYTNEDGVLLHFQNSVVLADWPVFIKPEYYQDLRNDLNKLKHHLFKN